MKHERTKESGTITLKPGETWIVDEQCMILHKGYLADWVGYNEGMKFFLEDRPGTKDFLSPDGTVTFDIDYGTEIETAKPSSPE